MNHQAYLLGPVTACAVDDGGNSRDPEEAPGRDLPVPFHPRDDPEYARFARRDPEREVDEGE